MIGLTGTKRAPQRRWCCRSLATQILWINLITDSGPALAMGVDPTADDVMARKPRPLSERVIDARMWAEVLQTGAVMAVVTLLTIDLYLPGGLIEGTRDLATARTAGLSRCSFSPSCSPASTRARSLRAHSRIFSPTRGFGARSHCRRCCRWQSSTSAFLNLAFGTAPLAFDQWLLCVAMASVVLWYSELRKLVSRAWGR